MKTKCSYCGKEINKKPSEISRSKNLYCDKICCANHKKDMLLGRNNFNAKYDLDDNFFKNIDTEFKAWMLGWIASDGTIRKNYAITIAINKIDSDVLLKIQDNFCKEIPIKDKKNTDIISYTLHSKIIVEDICNLLQIAPGKKSNIVNFPNIPSHLYRHFVRGYFEGDGTIRKPSDIRRTPECSIVSNSNMMLNKIGEYSNIPNKINYRNHSISWHGVNAIDFLGKIYDNCKYFMIRKRDLFYDWCNWQPILNKNEHYKVDDFYVCRTDKNAVLPSKTRVSDSGYDLTLIEKIKKVGRVEFYNTGIKVKPPFGYYFDLVARSSISKTGYILANGIGIIDRAYSGNIIVPLLKIDNTMPDIELPCRIVQIIPRKISHFEIIESDELDKTERGEGGFGSTNKF